jgi:hypothetical protein
MACGPSRGKGAIVLAAMKDAPATVCRPILDGRCARRPVVRRFIMHETSGWEMPRRTAAAGWVRPSALMRLAI